MLVLLCAVCAAGARAAEPARPAVELAIQGAIGPASADYVHRGIEYAQALGAGVVILRLDTPGGLDSAMRDIIRDILHSPVAVVGYVAPGGARAASAGTYILYACQVAAMAPGTNLGAATPVEIGGLGGAEPAKPPPAEKSPAGAGSHAEVMAAKRVNDAAAYLRSLAQLRGRNTEWAELAVREAASLPAEEALKKHVVDLLAQDEQDLLKKLQGRHVSIAGVEQVLDTQDLSVVQYLPDWRNRLLATITDPNVAYILLLIGIYGLFFEFASPGFVLPGVAGGISLLLALYAFQILPVNYAGLALVALGIAFMLAESFVPSFGALGIGGVLAFVAGSILLYDQAGSGYAVSLPLIIGLAVVSAGFFLFIVGAAIKARRRPVVSGAEELLQATGEALEDFNGPGRIRVHGETWLARSTEPVACGERVRVTALDGLVLQVRRLSGEEE
jgi:membrane-bound serine protease (ClpP class)